MSIDLILRNSIAYLLYAGTLFLFFYYKAWEKLQPISDWCKHRAIFFDDLGRFVGKKTIDIKEVKFAHKGKAYNIKSSEVSFFPHVNIIFKTKFYFYNINNPDPLILGKTVTPLISAKTYNAILESDLIYKLNNIKDYSWLQKLFNPRIIFTVLIVLFLLMYYFSGGKIF